MLIRNAFANSGQVGVNSNYLVVARADSAKAGGDRDGVNIIYNLRAIKLKGDMLSGPKTPGVEPKVPPSGP